MFFSGTTQQKKVSLGGRSRGEETREQTLERTRAEREKRQRNKLQNKSALLIQSHWRQLATARSVQSELRRLWAHLCGSEGSWQALQQLFAHDTRALSSLLHCYNFKQQADREALAAVCAGLTSAATTGPCPLLTAAAAAVPQSQSSKNGAQSAAAAGSTQEQLALFRVQKLALLCLSTLAAGGQEAAAALSIPYASLTSAQQQQQQQQPLAAMVDFLIRIVNPDTWKPSIQAAAVQQQQQQQQQDDTGGAQAAAAAAAAGAEAVLRHLFNKQLMMHLRMLLLSLGPSAPSKTCAEVCATQMVVRALKLQLLPVISQQPAAADAPAGASPTAGTPTSHTPASTLMEAATAVESAAGAAIRLGASQLLCVPGLWAKAPSLAPVAGRLCGLVLGELGVLQNSRQLTDALLQCTSAQASSAGSRKPVQTPTGAAAAAAADAAAVAVGALAENFVEAAAAGTIFRGLSQADQVSTAGKLVSFLVLLLDTARQLSVMQRRHWRGRLHKQGQRQQGTGRSIYDTGAGAGTSRKAGYVPGAGFVAPKGAAAADMEVDVPDRGLGMQQAEVSAAAGGAPAAQSVQAAAAAGEAAAAMEVDQPASEAWQCATGMGSSAAATTAGAPAAGASGSPSKVSKAAAADAAAIEQPVAASAWSAEDRDSSSKPSEVTATEATMQLLAGSTKGLQLLRLLVATLLPATTAAEARTLRQQQQATATSPTAAAALPPGCPSQQQLLELIWGLSRAPEYRQKVWLGLGVGARLVPRLWYSLVLPSHLSTPGGLLYYTGSTSSSSSSGRVSSSGSLGLDVGQIAVGGTGSWVLPMLVLSQAFNAALSFTHVEDFYAPEGASSLVPLTQLYDVAAPAAGLVMLVKAAVWQILWFNSMAPPGLPPPPPAMQQQQQQLKAAVAEVCGLLLCQLHDRNCLRQFCPPSAFLCELATAAPARLQAEVAAAADRMGAQGEDSDGDGDGTEDSAWQQQQQWQQQRQQGLGPLAAVAGSVDGAGGFGSRDSSAAGVTAAAGGVDGSDGTGGPDGAAAGGGRSPGSRVWVVLQHAPCLVPFELRVQLLQHVLELEKAAAVESGETRHMWNDFNDGFPQLRFVTIRRDELMEDGFSQIGRMDPDRVKGRLRIQYVNEAGLPEAGIDGGGLFKDFMEELLRQGFSPQSHLMAENPQHQLYPSPAAFAKYTDAEHRLGFLGRMLGKCLYEGMLLELPLAAFFLKKMRGGVCDINDMPSLDPEVYKHLLQLRHYKGDFADLSLNFTATVAEPVPFGTGTRQREVELKPGGRDIAVKADNVIEYVHRLADFRLNRQMDRAAAAFLRGFFELIKPRWVRMFNEAELQMLISGSEEGVDVDDLMKHINYAGGYHEEHPVVITLWETLRSFTPQEQRQFLKFVTSCSRAPLLGFAYLEPQLCVQMSGGMLQSSATQRLPTAATCMNLLKLPPYRTVKEMREKLLYAISAGAGFELS